MSPQFEEILVFAIITILVALFAWIYLRDRQKSIGLWMLGWVAILIHFAVPPLARVFPTWPGLATWIMVATLVVAGSCFLLSVSEVFVRQSRRVAFVVFVSVISLAYLT